MVESKLVTVAGAIADKPSRLVAAGDAIEVLMPQRFVGRGAEKLEKALDHFVVSVEGRHVLDAGSSTGGFTDSCLQRGAASVFAVDVGHNQLHEKLRHDPRVVSREGCNIRDLTQDELPFPCSLVVADLSFISLTKVLGVLAQLVTTEPGFPSPEMIVLVKPQFEVGRQEASKGKGVITDPILHERVLQEVGDFARSVGLCVAGVVESPIHGADGNREFLMHLIVGNVGPVA
jgi:23S rRNA (cytidine1920-2'-O)/16S rRNA (cytidine1409-2'-O)-methyltransferase